MKPPIQPADDRHFEGRLREAHFSWLRTRLSMERTLMSVMRTATALIGFGFTIFSFFDNLNQMESVRAAQHPGVVAAVAMSMVAAGVVMLIIALLEYRQGLHHLWNEDFVDIAGFTTRAKRTPMYYSALLLVAIGMFILVAVVWRMLAA